MMPSPVLSVVVPLDRMRGNTDPRAEVGELRERLVSYDPGSVEIVSSLGEARGDYVSALQSTDTPLPCYLEGILESLETPGVDVVGLLVRRTTYPGLERDLVFYSLSRALDVVREATHARPCYLNPVRRTRLTGYGPCGELRTRPSRLRVERVWRDIPLCHQRRVRVPEGEGGPAG